jgi:hypothetical protein
MRVRLRFERIYGTTSRYGENPRESPSGSPILLDDYPLPGERVTIYLGQPVEELYRTYNVARTGAFMLVRRNVLHEAITDTEEKEAVEQAQAEDLRDDLTRWNWYITIVIERTLEVPDKQCDPAHWFSIDPGVAIRIEREFLQYGSDQAQFLVDHLATLIPRHFFSTQDVNDRVVFSAGEGPPFRVPEVTMGNVTVSTSSPLERCNVEEIRGALSKLQSEGQMALTPLTPATLLTLVERATTADLKGRALEELVSKLFLTIPGLKVMSRIKTATEEIDIGIFNDATNGFLASEGAVILAECKNWSGKCGRDEFSLLEMKAENRRERCSLSFLISWNGFAGTIDKELLRSSRQRLVIVPLTGTDLRRAVEDNSFVEVIQSAWRDAVFT